MAEEGGDLALVEVQTQVLYGHLAVRVHLDRRKFRSYFVQLTFPFRGYEVVKSKWNPLVSFESTNVGNPISHFPLINFGSDRRGKLGKPKSGEGVRGYSHITSEHF